MIIISSALAHTVTVVPFGSLGDKLGRRKLFTIANWLALAGGVIGATSNSSLQLVLSRVVSGIGEGGIMAVGLALLATLQPKKNLPTAVSRWTVFITLAIVSMSYLTSIATSTYNWRIAFMLIPLFSIVYIALTPFIIPESYGEKNQASILSFGILGISLALAVGFFLEVAYHGFNFLSIIMGCISLLTFFAWHKKENKSSNPSFPVSILTNRNYLGGVIAAFGYSVIYGGLSFRLPIFFEVAENLKGSKLGLALAPVHAFGIIASLSVGALIARKVLSRKQVISIGFIASLIGYIMLTQLDSTYSLWKVLLVTLIIVSAAYFAAIPSFEIIAASAPSKFLATVTSSHAVVAQLGKSIVLLFSAFIIQKATQNAGDFTDQSNNIVSTIGNKLNLIIRPDLFFENFTAPMVVKTFHLWAIAMAAMSAVFIALNLIIYRPQAENTSDEKNT